MRYVIIANPAAGRGRAGRLADDIHRRLVASGAACCIQHTSAKGDAETLTLESLGTEAPDTTTCIVPCGGDGTVQEAVNALLATGPSAGVLGLAPAGRCNDFASAFGASPDAGRIVDVLLNGRPRHVDVGRVNDRYFCTIAAFGFDAAVSRFVNDMKMPLSGTVAYVYGVLRVLQRYRPEQVNLIYDDGRRVGPLFMVASANTPTYGGSMRVSPDARPDDGLLDVCVVSPLDRWRVIRLLRRVMDGRHTDLPEVDFVRTKALRIETDGPCEVWADGELVGQTPATIEAVPGRLVVMTPES